LLANIFKRFNTDINGKKPTDGTCLPHICFVDRQRWRSIEINKFSNIPDLLAPHWMRGSGKKIKSMYALRNKVQLIGHLGGKPEVKQTSAGRKWATFRIATNESYRNAKGEKVTETQWHRIVAWGKVAEVVEKYCDKGKEVALEGKLVTRIYNDKDGSKKYMTEVQASELLLLGKPLKE
jgi:single-strand DNA-binding protein